MELDTSQRRAVSHRDGPMMVLAGPGSGKTLVITRRIRHLIREYHIPPEHILVITFTKAAAKEMRERFERMEGSGNTQVTFGTFHAIYFAILRNAYGYTAANIVREEQRVRFVREYIRRLGLDYEDENEFITALLAEISLVKNTSVQLDSYYATCCGEDIFRKIYRAYEQFLRRGHFLDFDDMLVLCRELFEQRKDILRAWQNKFRYILIDEFQDINRIQYEIIGMLAGSRKNLFVVGDDDQSIYRFRGARPEIMLRFGEDYPDAKRVVLGTNYRCGKEIVEASGRLIAHNRNRYPKELTSAVGEDIPVKSLGFSTQREQNLYVIREISRLCKEGIGYGQMAVLFRTNVQPRYLMEQMISFNLPFRSRDAVPSIYDHWIAEDILTYLRIAGGERSRRAMLKIMNRPARYLSRDSLSGETVDFARWRAYYREQDRMIRRIQKLEEDLSVIARMRPFSAINYLRRGVGYEDFLREYARERKISEEELLDILDELQTGARGFDTIDSWFSHIREFQRKLRDQAEKQRLSGEAVTLTTLHSSKGLEYDTVFLVDVNENIMPYRKAVLEEDLEEERRMFYVGMTRAKRRLYLLYSAQIRNKEMEPSRFLAEAGL